ncbi:MAG: hypothetical protein K6E20_03695 [Acholeplasmatales bacterium]|nr:hypothetical protein [Acholeplasmatales bacterium]
MVVLENDVLKININENGGCLSSIFDKIKKEELLYQPDKRSWSGQDVVIFPFVARLKNNSYTVDGKEYSMKNHGIIRYNKLNVWEANETKAILYLDSNSDTLKEYPYNFHFEVIYELNHNKLSIKYKITNTDNKEIYYEFGGHPALKVDGAENDQGFEIKDTILEFENNIVTEKFNLDDSGSYIVNKTKVSIPSEFIITKKIIEDSKTLIFDAKNINKCILKTKGYRFYFDIEDFEILALWTYPGYGDYLCVEPWCGIPDIFNPNKELKAKPLMHKLNPNESEEKGFSITIAYE